MSPSPCIRRIRGTGTVLADLSSLVERTTAALEAFDHATALAETERFFWSGLADNYLELVKTRLREGPDNNDGAASAANTLRVSLRVFLRLFAPFIAVRDRRDLVVVSRSPHGFPSIHRAPWPSPTELAAISGPEDPQSFILAVAAIDAVRRYKADAQVSVGAPLERVVLAGAPEDVVRLERVQDDIALAARAVRLTLRTDARVPRGTFEVLEAEWALEG